MTGGDSRESPGSIGQALREATAALRRGGSATPRLDAGVLLAHVTGLSREALLTRPQRPLDRSAAAAFDRAVARRLEQCPVAYITGRREFMSVSLEVSPAVLIPRPETELLVEVAASLASGEGVLAADIGTGSGAVAIALARLVPGLRLIATDISVEALAVARRNVERLGLAARIELCLGNLLEPLSSMTLDGVVANLPYVTDAEWESLAPGVRDFEPPLSLRGGPDGLDVFRRLASGLPSRLAPGGFVALEVGAGQAGAVADILLATGFFPAVQCHRDPAGHERVVSARRLGVRR